MSNYIATYLVLPTGGVVALPADSAGTRANKVLKWSGDGMTLINTAVADGIDGEDGLDGDDGTDGVGVPSGGTTNQQLRKLDGTDYNTEWHTLVLADISDVTVTDDYVSIPKGIRPGQDDDTAPDGLGYIFESVNDGHLYWVHRDGGVHLLCSDGIYGGGSAGDAALTPGFVDGLYYVANPSGMSAPTRNIEADRQYFIPIHVPVTIGVNRIGLYCQTGTGGSSIRLGIYSNANGLPGTLLLDAGTVATDTTGEREITIAHTLTAGWYWLSALSSDIVNIIMETGYQTQSPLGFASGSAVDAIHTYLNFKTFGALGAVGSLIAYSNINYPRLWIRKV